MLVKKKANNLPQPNITHLKIILWLKFYFETNISEDVSFLGPLLCLLVPPAIPHICTGYSNDMKFSLLNHLLQETQRINIPGSVSFRRNFGWDYPAVVQAAEVYV